MKDLSFGDAIEVMRHWKESGAELALISGEFIGAPERPQVKVFEFTVQPPVLMLEFASLRRRIDLSHAVIRASRIEKGGVDIHIVEILLGDNRFYALWDVDAPRVPLVQT
jgi:hypothetical protein